MTKANTMMTTTTAAITPAVMPIIDGLDFPGIFLPGL
jgi:hypothetical protein